MKKDKEQFIDSPGAEAINDEGNCSVNPLVLSDQSITQSHKVLIGWKLHARHAALVQPAVHPGFEDIHILLVEIPGHGQGVALPPNMDTLGGKVHERKMENEVKENT